jgi:putative spermidine/putrescine transport system substrate-binding protein
MYLWMEHITSPQVQAEVAEWFGEAPANEKACDLTENKNHCKEYDAAGENYLDDLYYWQTPLKDCGDDRGEECVDYNTWVQGWTEEKG